jgi:hypothetical protein
MQSVWGYSALRTGLAYLPLAAVIMVSSGAAAQFVGRIGARPLLLAGSSAAAQAGHPPRPSQAALTAIHHHALATGCSRAFLAAAGVILLALVITIIAIRVRRADLSETRL